MLLINENSKKSIREAFGKKLVELGSQYPNIVVLDADLSCSTQTKMFAKEFASYMIEGNPIYSEANLARHIKKFYKE